MEYRFEELREMSDILTKAREKRTADLQAKKAARQEKRST